MRAAAAAIVLLALTSSFAAQPAQRPAARIPPVAKAQWEGRAGNDVGTFARHPALLNQFMPFVAYASSESTLPARHRELLMLRTAWLCRSAYVWSQHAAVARQSGLTDQEIGRIADGPDAPGWSALEKTLLQAADELMVNAFLTDRTWAQLSGEYSRTQMMDVVFVVGASMMLSAALNTFGTEPEQTITPLPSSGKAPSVAVLGKQDVRLDRARIPLLEPADWTPEIRAMLDPTGSGRAVGAVFRTYAQHPKAYPSRQLLSDYIRSGATVTERTKELLILRIGWLGHCAYQWSTHEQGGRRLGMTDAEILGLTEGPGADVWEPLDAALVRAVDELHRDSFISDRTWNTIARHYNTQQLMDVVITATGYRMVAMALNTFGVQMEPGARGFPTQY
jgi:alkylhydroperoxidase family enzyme